jgi:EpsI family protein
MVWMFAAAIMLLAGDFLGFRVLAHLSILPMLVGVIVAVWAAEAARRMWFPLVFLVFMVPIPPSITQSVALNLKLLAAETSVRLANLFTLPMVRQGSYVHFGDDSLLVGDICGGLRSLISLLALAALVAFLSRAKTWARVILLAMSGPIAIVANVVRIFFLCVVGFYWGSDTAGGRVHDYSGFMIYAVAIALLLGSDSLLRRVGGSRSERPLFDASPEAAVAPGRAQRAISVAAAAVLAAVTTAHVGIVRAQGGTRGAPEEFAFEIPSKVVDYRQIGQDFDIDERTRELLQTSTILIRNYRAPNRRPVQLTIVYAGSTRRSLHFPEVCLVGEGWEIVRQESSNVGVLFTARRLILVKGEQSQAVLYWFKTGGHVTGNYFLNAWQWARNQITFGSPTSAMFKLTTPVSSDGEAGAFAALEDFAAKFAPIMMERIQ